MSTAARLGQLAVVLVIAIVMIAVVVRWRRRRETPLERFRRLQEP